MLVNVFLHPFLLRSNLLKMYSLRRNLSISNNGMFSIENNVNIRMSFFQRFINKFRLHYRQQVIYIFIYLIIHPRQISYIYSLPRDSLADEQRKLRRIYSLNKLTITTGRQQIQIFKIMHFLHHYSLIATFFS